MNAIVRVFLVSLCGLVANSHLARGFVVQQASTNNRAAWTASLPSTADGEGDMESSSSSSSSPSPSPPPPSNSMLVLKGDSRVVSDPLPDAVTRLQTEQLRAFWQQPSVRNALFSAGSTRPVEALETTPQFLEYWTEQCRTWGYDRTPTVDDAVVCTTATMQFPGVQLATTSASGVYLMENAATGLPEYHSFFLAEKQQVTGLRPSVWLFNQLTGNAQKEKGVFYPASGQARSVVALEPTTTSTNDKAWRISFDVELSIFVKVPASMLKFFPVSKEKAEEQASAGIVKTVRKDTLATLDAVQRALLDYAAAQEVHA